MVRDVRSGAVDGDGDVTEAIDSVTALTDTDTVEGMVPIEGWIMDEIDDGAFDEAMPEVKDDAAPEAPG